MLGASPARALDLIELHALAVRNDPAFQAALKDRDAGVAQKDIGRAGLLPSINYRYSTGQNRSRVTQSTFLGDITEHRNYRSYSSSVELQQPLLDYEAISAYRQGEALALFSNETYRGKARNWWSGYSKPIRRRCMPRTSCCWLRRKSGVFRNACN